MNKLKNKIIVPAGAIFLSVLMLLACASDGAAKGAADRSSGGDISMESSTSAGNTGGANIADIQNKDWTLDEMIINSTTVSINRTSPVDMGETFTLRFDANNVGGKGYPNTFFGPYTAGDGNALSIGMLAATLMMPLFELDSINESQYFAYLDKVISWEVRDGKLELQTSGANGEAVVLIYR